jgi:indole-3-glycerol phosphate synthase
VGFLSDVVEHIRKDLELKPPDDSALMARAMSMPPVRGIGPLLAGELPALIAGIERASPWSGPSGEIDPRALATAYEAGGASAVSVVTESRHFDGSLSDLRAAHLSCRLPVLRRDFPVHPAQLMEARVHGADGVFVVAAALSDAELHAMVRTAADLGLAAVVEIYSEGDLRRATLSGAELVCINERDLESLHKDEKRALELVRKAGPERPVILAGSIFRREQVERAMEAGALGVLAGEALVRARNPAAKLRQLRGELAAVE